MGRLIQGAVRARGIQPAALVAPVAPAGLPDKVLVPELVLGQATGWTPPTECGLGEVRDYALGDGLVHLTWPSAPGVQALEERGRQAGWTEVYDALGNWIALVGGRPVADAAGELLLSATPPTHSPCCAWHSGAWGTSSPQVTEQAVPGGTW